MAKVARRRLKVFQAQVGFYDTVVAAPSQAAALRAWGIHQNLFADGRARLTDDAKAIAAALRHPETPLRRAVGTNDPFAIEPTGLPKVPAAPKRPAERAAKAKPPPPMKRPADRSGLDAAEAALRRVDEDRRQEEAAFRRRQDDLDAARAEAQSGYVDQRARASAAVVEARKAYLKAGGED